MNKGNMVYRPQARVTSNLLLGLMLLSPPGVELLAGSGRGPCERTRQASAEEPAPLSPRGTEELSICCLHDPDPVSRAMPRDDQPRFVCRFWHACVCPRQRGWTCSCQDTAIVVLTRLPQHMNAEATHDNTDMRRFRGPLDHPHPARGCWDAHLGGGREGGVACGWA